MTDLLDKRVTELEAVLWDIPNPVNLRFTRFDTEFATIRGAISALDRSMVALQTDMRDVRGGITHHLVAPEAQLRAMHVELAQMKSDIRDLNLKVDSIGNAVQELLRRLPSV